MTQDMTFIKYQSEPGKTAMLDMYLNNETLFPSQLEVQNVPDISIKNFTFKYYLSNIFCGLGKL